MTVNNKLNALRERMRDEHIDAYIISSHDPHQSGDVASYYKSRKWISGFTGSAGSIVITQEHAGLWVDSRYYIQAEEETSDNEFNVFRMGMSDVPDFEEWILENLDNGQVAALDGMVFSVKQCRELKKKLAPKSLILRTDIDIVDEIWSDRPALPGTPVKDHDLKFAGRSREEKLVDIRYALFHLNADAHLICRLDDIAWTLNIRGNDIHHQPLAMSFLLISQKKCIWFIDSERLPSPLHDAMKDAGVRVLPHNSIVDYLTSMKGSASLLLDSADISQTLLKAIPENCHIIEGKSPVSLMKSCKNRIEVKGARSACTRDGAAMVKFLYWLEDNIGKTPLTEISCSDKAEELRSSMEFFQDISFNSIVGYQEHAALCHYSVTDDTNVEIRKKGFFLIDSGGHYLDGTTDITRTIAVGDLTEKQKKDYTLVLKAHINLASAVFHEDAKGGDLEVLARLPLWKEGRQYGHGAGHGIGSYLMVHEGPAGFGRSETKLKEGMILTNEPGIYREGEYGIRIENMVTVVPFEKTEFGNFFKFETISMCPIDLTPVIHEMLTEDESKWLNDYHQKVIKTLEPLLEPEEMSWLRNATDL